MASTRIALAMAVEFLVALGMGGVDELHETTNFSPPPKSLAAIAVHGVQIAVWFK